MLRIVPGVVAAFALAMVSLAAAPAAKAQIEVEKEVDRTSVPLVQADSAHAAAAKACRKVKYAFVCRDGNKGSGKAACRRGETQAQCCARIKKTVAQACKPHGGLAKFKCKCTGKKGGKRPEPRAGIREVSPDTSDPAFAAEPPAEPGVTDRKIRQFSSVDGFTAWQRARARPGAMKCSKVRYAFACRRGGGKASGAARCRRGENARACCARVRRLANRTCARHGGIAKIKCGCPRPRPGRGPGGKIAPGEPGSSQYGGSNTQFFDVFVDLDPAASEPGNDDTAPAKTLKSKKSACAQVAFSYLCRGERRTGSRTCRRNESERRCCDHAHSVETRNCGAVPQRWNCRCTN